MRLFLLIPALTLLAEETVTQPFEGVTHIHRFGTSPRHFSAHIVRINLNTPGLRFQLTPPQGARETKRQTTLAFLEEQKAQIAINAHFFTPFPSTEQESYLIGLAASDGRVYSQCEAPEQSYAITARAPALNISAANQASIVSCDSEGLYTAISGSAQVLTGGQVTVPEYRDEQHPHAPLTPGGPGRYSNARSWYEVPNARTLIGLSADLQTLFLFTVDKAGRSEGLSVREAAELLRRDYGVFDALNLDGGGSTTLVMQSRESGKGEIVNQPSGGQARAVASNLAVFLKE